MTDEAKGAKDAMNGDGSRLNERKKLILKAIIEAHVKEGEPVGSKYLTQNKQIALSSATIRNEMSELEEMGYLEQPHTSAGRVPSEHGYRFYVNSLMQKYRMSQNELARMNTLVKSRLAEVDKLLETATQLAAALTNYTSIAIKPGQSAAVITKFRLVFLTDEMLMLVMLMADGSVKTSQIHAEIRIDADMLERLEFMLNTRVAGKRADEITMPLVMELEKSFGDGDSLVGPVLKCICGTLGDGSDGEVRLSGVNNLLEYPEYADARKFKDLLGVLEEKRDLLKLVSESDEDTGRPQVIIGSENSVEEMQDSALVFQKIHSGGKVVGAIGILGPRRMDYSKVISTVEYIAENISGLLDPEKGLPPGGESGGNNNNRKEQS